MLCSSPFYFIANMTLPDLANNSGFRDRSQKSMNNNNLPRIYHLQTLFFNVLQINNLIFVSLLSWAVSTTTTIL